MRKDEKELNLFLIVILLLGGICGVILYGNEFAVREQLTIVPNRNVQPSQRSMADKRRAGLRTREPAPPAPVQQPKSVRVSRSSPHHTPPSFGELRVAGYTSKKNIAAECAPRSLGEVGRQAML